MEEEQLVEIVNKQSVFERCSQKLEKPLQNVLKNSYYVNLNEGFCGKSCKYRFSTKPSFEFSDTKKDNEISLEHSE